MSEKGKAAERHEIGWAVKQMWNGVRVRRAGWNGKGMWLALVTSWTFNVWLGPADNLPEARPLPFVMMRTADCCFVPWLCSQTDLLATDWEIAP